MGAPGPRGSSGELGAAVSVVSSEVWLNQPVLQEGHRVLLLSVRVHKDNQDPLGLQDPPDLRLLLLKPLLWPRTIMRETARRSRRRPLPTTPLQPLPPPLQT